MVERLRVLSRKTDDSYMQNFYDCMKALVQGQAQDGGSASVRGSVSSGSRRSELSPRWSVYGIWNCVKREASRREEDRCERRPGAVDDRTQAHVNTC